jgi:hypothetical protein
MVDMDLWIKIAVVFMIAVLVYREILKSISQTTHQSSPTKTKASFWSFIGVGAGVGGFIYVGMSMTLVETRDLRPYISTTPQMVSIFDKGVIELNGMVIKTNLARNGELTSLANQLTLGCNSNDGCEVQKIFDYVTHIPYKTDHTSRNAKEVIATNWGDCDDKSNLFASLLNERGLEYLFVYVPHHVFVVVHVKNTNTLPFLRAKLTIDHKDYYYAETTSTGARIGELNGQFPYSFEGIYDIKNDTAVDLERVKFGMG